MTRTSTRPAPLASRTARRDRLVVAAVGTAAAATAAIVNVHERLHHWKDAHPPYDPFDLLPVAVGLAIMTLAYLIVTRRRLRQEVAIRQEREAALTTALRKIDVLSGLLAMCASCKSIRNDDDQWESVELYLQRHGELAVSHGICPRCASKLYPDYIEVVGRSG